MSETIGARLRRRRLGLGRSARAVAAEAGIGYPYLSKLERDHNLPSDDVLVRLAWVLGEDADELAVVAGRVPRWAVEAFADDPPAAVDALRAFVGRAR